MRLLRRGLRRHILTLLDQFEESVSDLCHVKFQIDLSGKKLNDAILEKSLRKEKYIYCTEHYFRVISSVRLQAKLNKHLMYMFRKLVL